MEDVACNDDSADPLAVAVLYRASAGTDCSSNAGLTTIRRRRSGSSVLEAADPLRGDRVVSRPRRFRQEIQAQTGSQPLLGNPWVAYDEGSA